MKVVNILFRGMLLMSAVFWVACEDENILDEPAADINEIIGKYEGTTTISAVQGDPKKGSSRTATADVGDAGDGQITVHCYAMGIDTTFLLNTFAHNDSTMACLTGENFEKEYGHMMGQGHMMHGNISSGTEWMHHMDDEHQDSDDHFGGFDMNMHSFECDFEIMENDTVRNVHFNGTRN